MSGLPAICIIFFGLNRSLSQTIESINDCIYSQLKKLPVTVDTYTSFMDPGAAFTNARSGENNLNIEHDSTQLLGAKTNLIINQSEVDKIIGKINLDLYTDNWGDNHQSTRNLFRQLYSIKQGFEVALNSNSNYDYYFFFRPDLMYIDKFNFSKYLDCLKSSNGKGRIITPDWTTSGGLNDRYALCDRAAANVYAKRFDFAMSYLREKNEIHSEKLLLHILKLEKINYFRLSTERAARVRANHLIAPKDLGLCKVNADSLCSRIKLKVYHYLRSLKIAIR